MWYYNKKNSSYILYGKEYGEYLYVFSFMTGITVIRKVANGLSKDESSAICLDNAVIPKNFRDPVKSPRFFIHGVLATNEVYRQYQ